MAGKLSSMLLGFCAEGVTAHVPSGYFNRSVRPSFAIRYLLFVMRFAPIKVVTWILT
jgi:hypothetical protein